MTQRIITGVVAGAIFIGMLLLGGIWFELFVGALAGLTLFEFFKMKGLKIQSLEGVLALLACLCLVMPWVRTILFMGADGPFLLFAFFLFAMLAGMVFTKGKYSPEDVAFPFLAAFYVGLGFQALNLARQKGFLIVLLAMFIVWATDIGAYYVGRSFGAHKLAPAISPNKTVEGSLGGIASALLVSIIMLLVFSNDFPTISIWQMILYAIIFSAVSQLGDLIESAIKRHYDVKDSGTLLPGHGGLFDRFDSMILVLPIMHLFGLF